MREEVLALTQDMGMCNENQTTKQTRTCSFIQRSRIPSAGGGGGRSPHNVTQAVQHGNLSSGTHPARNVPEDGFLVSKLRGRVTLTPFNENAAGCHRLSVPWSRQPHPNTWDSIPVYPNVGFLLRKRCKTWCKRTCAVLSSPMRKA